MANFDAAAAQLAAGLMAGAKEGDALSTCAIR